MVIHSSFADFVLFLYVHVAHIDDSYDPKELSTIKSKMTKLYPEGTDVEKKLYQTIREYNKFDRSKINELCLDSIIHFKNDKQASESRLFDDVEDIIKADGEIHTLEAEALRKIRKMIEAHTA
jgi:uncharacterized tellurite resistance protein B-like protein